MAKAKIETYTMKITLPSLESLIDKVKDLTSLVSTVMFKFDKNDVLIYCLNGDKKGRSVHSFKSHIMKIDDVFKVTEDVPKKLRLCISDAKKFAVSLNMFIKYMTKQNITDDLTFKFSYNEDGFTERLQISNKKSKEEIAGGDPINFKMAIDIEKIQNMMDTDNSLFNFNLSKDDFDYIKSKTAIEKDSDTLYLNVNSSSLSIGESKWEHTICDVSEVDDTTLSFPKKYFKCINYNGTDNVVIYVFDTFILIIGNGTNLLISLELSV